MSNNNFEEWNTWASCHSDPEQLKRQKSASDKKLTPISIDSQMSCGTFKGSKSNYQTTLSECSCVDFHRRKLPCKHMYRLAHEINVSSLTNVTSLNTSILHKEEALHIIQSSLNEDEQQQFRDFCHICGNDNAGESVLSKEFSTKLLSCNLAQEVTDIRKLLKAAHIQIVRSFLPAGTKSPRTKAELIELVAPYATKEEIVFKNDGMCITLHSSISHLGHALHRHLCALYPRSSEFYWE